MLQFAVVVAVVGLASAGLSPFQIATNPPVSSSTSWFCPDFDWDTCFNQGVNCYSSFDFFGCEYCVCEDDGDLAHLTISILHHLAYTAHTDSLQAQDLAYQISLYADLLHRIHSDTVDDYYYGYKRALREVRSRRENRST